MPNHALASEPVARVLSRVQGAKPNGRGWLARCPAHDDRTPSLSIGQGDDGRALLKCHAGCELRAITAALNLEERELFPPKEGAYPPRQPAPERNAPRQFATAKDAADAYRATMGRESARWCYRDASGEPIGLVLRWNLEDGSKTIRPAWRIGNAWRHTYPEPRTLYALDRLGADPAARVFVVEGEKCAEQLAALGLQATTSAGGAKAAGRADWSPLAGREVAIVPDADGAGRKYAEEVRALLAALDPPARAAIVSLPGLAEGSGEDAVEFVGRVHGGDLAAARKAIEAATAAALAAAPRKRATIVELLADPRTLAKPRTISSGWEPWEDAQPFGAVEVGTVSVLAAPPGCYKTAAMLRLARGFAEQGHPVTWLAGEMQPRTLARRMVCQAAGLAQGALASGARPDEHDRRIDAARARLETLGDRLEFVGAPIGFEELERAADRAQVVFVDYLQLVRHPRPEVRGHERIEDAMAKIAECAQRTGAVIIVAASQGRDGGGQERDIHNATKGSSSIEYTVDALYCAGQPEAGPQGLEVAFKCLKQREGERRRLVVPIDDRTGLVAEEARS
jgi:hypothetical protein